MTIVQDIRTSVASPPSPEAIQLISAMRRIAPAFTKELEATISADPELFNEIATPLLGAAGKLLGADAYDHIVRGYLRFVVDVNKSQLHYEKEGCYRAKSFADVYDHVYGDDTYMNSYHWGVYATTFVWHHHLNLYRFYRDYFLPLLAPEPGRLLDLGAGSGVWHILTLRAHADWAATAVDISPRSIALARDLGRVFDLSERTHYIEGDALQYCGDAPFEAALSCFLLEHLEAPERLFENLANNLSDRAPAFVTGALTAAEIDHIAEFRRESEIVNMAERAGFRVIASYSAAPERAIPTRRFLPRSLALVLRKRQGEIW